MFAVIYDYLSARPPYSTLEFTTLCPFKKGFKTLLLKYLQCPSQIEVCTSLQSSKGSVTVFIILCVSSIFQPHDKKSSTVDIAKSQPVEAAPALLLSCICTINTTVISVWTGYQVKFKLSFKKIQNQSKMQLPFKFT